MTRASFPLALLLTLTLTLLLVPLAACGGAPEDAAEKPAADDAAAAESGATSAIASTFRLATLDGAELGPEDYAGQVVLVDFWATWCVPCHAQNAVLQEVWNGLGDDAGVQFLAVDVGETETQVRGFTEKNPFPYPVLLDSESRTADSLGVYSLPTLLVLDREGEVSYLEAGILAKEELCEVLETAGASKPC